MRKAYIVQETEDTPNSTTLKHVGFRAGLLALLRFGHIKISNCENNEGMFLVVEIREDGVG